MVDISSFSSKEFNNSFTEVLATLLMNPRVAPCTEPQAILLGGQSGAGKSTLHVVHKEKLADNVLVINGDEYRKAHPRFTQIQQRYGIDAPAHTAAWAGQMVEALIDELSGAGYNLIIEGTLRTSSVPLATAAKLQERGYAVDLALMAVKPEISLVSCKIRYERMRIAGTTPRAVDPVHHERIVNDIVENLAELERSDLFESVALFNRAGVCLFTAQCPTQNNPASRALHDILFGRWAEEERAHYELLLDELASLENDSPADSSS